MPVKKSNQMCQANRKIINKTESFKKTKKEKKRKKKDMQKLALCTVFMLL